MKYSKIHINFFNQNYKQSKIKQFYLFYFFSLLVLINSLSCTQSFSQPPLLKNAAKDDEILIIWQDDAIKMINNEKTSILSSLIARFDFDPRISVTDDCFHLLSSSVGIQSFCKKKNSTDNIFTATKTPLEGLPQRLWRDQKTPVMNYKSGVNYRIGTSGNGYWVSHYALAMRKNKSWHPIPGDNRFYDAVSDILEIKNKDQYQLLLATPYNGLKTTTISENDKTRIKWKKTGKGLPYQEYVKGLAFYEGIESIVQCGGKIYAALSFNQGLMVSKDNAATFQSVTDTPTNHKNIEKNSKNLFLGKHIQYLSCSSKSTNQEGQLFISGENHAVIMNTKTNKIMEMINTEALQNRIKQSSGKSATKAWLYYPKQKALFAISFPNKTISDVAASGISTKEQNTQSPGQKDQNSHSVKRPGFPAEEVRGLYIPTPKAKGKTYINLLKRMNRFNLNALVIDFKDDFGRLIYDSQIPMAKEAKAVKKLINVATVVKQAHEHNIKIIARLVVFKDNRLFAYQNNKFTLMNKRTKRPWQFFREYWVDAHNEEVWKYNIAIAAELAELGVDEIQFDYVRFPTDGPTGLIQSRFLPHLAQLHSESLYDFLARANAKINIPIGIDVYGFNAWYRAGAILGQDVSLLARQVQVISPMYYPSHFGNRWYMKGPRSERSYRILYDGTKRATTLYGHTAIVRPYLQNFSYNAPTFGKYYLLNQIQGVYDGQSRSFLFWNALGKYEKLFQSLENYDPKTYKAR